MKLILEKQQGKINETKNLFFEINEVNKCLVGLVKEENKKTLITNIKNEEVSSVWTLSILKR